MSKFDDLRLVFSAIETNHLELLRGAIYDNLVCRCRFVDGKGKGCLMYWASGREVVDRQRREQWTASLLGGGEKIRSAILRIIVGWDAVEPEVICKGLGYATTYPESSFPIREPSYMIMASEVLAVVEEVLAARAEANAAEEAAVVESELASV